VNGLLRWHKSWSHDQDAFNQLVREGINFYGDPDAMRPQPQPREMNLYRKTVWTGIMPASRFLSGHSFWITKLHEVGLRWAQLLLSVGVPALHWRM
jgi:hypothetical protein